VVAGYTASALDRRRWPIESADAYGSSDDRNHVNDEHRALALVGFIDKNTSIDVAKAVVSRRRAEWRAPILESDEKIDVLFVDLSLMDSQEAGLHLAQAAAKHRPGLPVVYTTGRGVTDVMRALFVERNVFLAKPYSMRELLTAVSNVLK
jgi:DNA-binding NtrC family response regulator